MSAVKSQPGSPLPFRADGGLVFLGKVSGGFSVRGCPQPEQLAAYIVHAANAYPKLVEVLRHCEARLLHGPDANPNDGLLHDAQSLLRSLGEAS